MPFEGSQEALVGGASTVNRTRTDVEALLTKLRGVIDQLSMQGWQGSAAMAFGRVATSWDGSVKKLLVAMAEIEDLLKKSGDTFSVTEDQQRSLMERTVANYPALGG